ncbi:MULTISPECIES: peptidoglycan DD-metalloendopeptidase family protein [Fusobacterium]|uniref:peptidoglycan DD-metalloendopeptidase family protein n=1 Tax=Fusobacterium TaxID=848 RepID=UPI001476E580|nr:MULTISPECIES: M23 family metallopeptidase [Fusobacterium]NME35440.1 M23 family metallopeptidase [Fusobacterium sp. FSA-380-WT-3A]
MRTKRNNNFYQTVTSAKTKKTLRNKDALIVTGFFILMNLFIINLFLKPFSKEVVNTSEFTEYYQKESNNNIEDVFSVLGRNYFTIKRNYNLKTKEVEEIQIEDKNENIEEKKDIPKDSFKSFKDEFYTKRENDIVGKMEYTVKSGDNLSEIAEMFSQSISIIRENNPKLGSTIYVGQKIILSTVNGIFYKIKSGDTLYDLASKYKVNVETIRKYNNLKNDILVIGDELFLKNPDINSLKNLGEKFVMPVKYKGITSPYGNRFHPVLKRYILHSGVDLVARYVPVYAAKRGEVTFAGVAGGYGNLVKIKHSDGYETRYAHLNKINVKKGQKIQQGQIIGESGMTGRVTGPHLHFEVRKNGKTLNPMEFLRK